MARAGVNSTSRCSDGARREGVRCTGKSSCAQQRIMSVTDAKTTLIRAGEGAGGPRGRQRSAASRRPARSGGTAELPRQTVHRLLGQLERAGLVVRDPSRERYSVGPRMTKLSFASLRSLNQAAPVRSILQDLVDDIGETCNIGVLDGLDYVYLQRIECDWPLRLHMEIGSRMGAHWVSGGKVLLAHLDAELCQRLLRSRKLKAPPRTRSTSCRAGGRAGEDPHARLCAERPGVHGRHRRRRGAGHRSEGQRAGRSGHAGPAAAAHPQGVRESVPHMRHAAERIARVWFD